MIDRIETIFSGSLERTELKLSHDWALRLSEIDDLLVERDLKKIGWTYDSNLGKLIREGSIDVACDMLKSVLLKHIGL